MASLRVEVMSNEMIKPSSPTPENAKTLQLSLFDQFAPPSYMPLLFFYPNEKKSDINDISLTPSMILKSSLSETLVHFYPLAGRLKIVGAGHPIVDCNDEGIEFYDARVFDMELSSILGNRNSFVEELAEFLPFDPTISSLIRGTACGVKVNYFDCGGIIIGLCFSHKIGDAMSFIHFVKTWASITKDGDNETSNGAKKWSLPKFDLALHFPPRDLSQLQPPLAQTDLAKEENVKGKRFVFDKKKLDVLKEQACHVQGRPPSRVEVVSAFFWKIIISQASARARARALARDNLNDQDDGKLITACFQAMNLRTRVGNSHDIDSENMFGNMLWTLLAKLEQEGDNEITQHELIEQIRESKRKVDGEFVKNPIQIEECLLERKKFWEMLISRDVFPFCGMTSLCHFPLYDVNFGWGKPEWVSLLAIKPFKNVAILWDTKCGEAVEGLVCMLEHDLADFEHSFTAIV